MDTSTTIKVLTTLGLVELTLSHPVLLAVFLTLNYIVGQLDESQKTTLINFFKDSNFGVTTILDVVTNLFKFSKVEDLSQKVDYFEDTIETEAETKVETETIN